MKHKAEYVDRVFSIYDVEAIIPLLKKGIDDTKKDISVLEENMKRLITTLERAEDTIDKYNKR